MEIQSLVSIGIILLVIFLVYSKRFVVYSKKIEKFDMVKPTIKINQFKYLYWADLLQKPSTVRYGYESATPDVFKDVTVMFNKKYDDWVNNGYLQITNEMFGVTEQKRSLEIWYEDNKTSIPDIKIEDTTKNSKANKLAFNKNKKIKSAQYTLKNNINIDVTDFIKDKYNVWVSSKIFINNVIFEDTKNLGDFKSLYIWY